MIDLPSLDSRISMVQPASEDLVHQIKNDNVNFLFLDNVHIPPIYQYDQFKTKTEIKNGEDPV